jgi:hypothetical protein
MSGEQPYVSLTALLTATALIEQRHRGETPHAVMHIVIPHGKGTRAVAFTLDLDQCLALAANAADAARLLAPYRTLRESSS